MARIVQRTLAHIFRSRLLRCALVACVAVALLIVGLKVTIHRAAFTGLGHLPDSKRGSDAWAISPDGGTVVGGVGLQGFSWSATTGMVGLGIDPKNGVFGSVAAGVSGAGQVIVGSDFWTVGPRRVFRLKRGGEKETLWNLPKDQSVLPTPVESHYGFFRPVAAVSGDGAVIVGARSYNALFVETIEAVRWTEKEAVVGLGFLPGARMAPCSAALAASADGLAVVGGSSSVNGMEAFRWTPEEGMRGLGGLGGDPKRNSYVSCAYGVSADGSVVVGSSYCSESGSIEAFRWTADGGMQRLAPLLPRGSEFDSTASAVSGDGRRVVGWVGVSHRAFIWEPEHGMRLLTDVLGAQGVDLTFWQLHEARGISNDGRVVVGSGRNLNTGQSEAWMATLR